MKRQYAFYDEESGTLEIRDSLEEAKEDAGKQALEAEAPIILWQSLGRLTAEVKYEEAEAPTA
jgi:hypothetical protein